MILLQHCYEKITHEVKKMILEFSIKNWLSFREQVSLSTIASRERQHRERVPRIDRYKIGILPVTVIYGGNASGKTNLFNALSFAKKLVVKGMQPDSLIPIEPFRLDSSGTDLPVHFSFELLIEDMIYEYSFLVNQKAVLEEKLVRISSSSERILYSRKNNKPNFHTTLEKDQFLNFAFKGTRDNQLFLTNSVSQKVETFKPVYDWFKNTLELVSPDSRFGPFEQFLNEASPLYSTMNSMLAQLDTGIARLGGEEIPFENLPFPETLKTKLREDVKEGDTVRFLDSLTNERFLITREGSKLVAKKLVTFHSKTDGSDIQFEMRHESDGSKRVIDLLPVFLKLSAANSKKVYVVDEVNRSLHTILIRRLLEAYLSCCSPKSRSQLLFTTHDVLLMDQQLFRRDEMWATERDKEGVTSLIPFSEFKDIRYDKDIRKSYIQGRLGGVPRILPGSILASTCHDEKES
jgi:AAA15 family ATPase/GTPase